MIIIINDYEFYFECAYNSRIINLLKELPAQIMPIRKKYKITFYNIFINYTFPCKIL